MRSYLVIGNQTLAGPELAAAIAERIAAEPSQFHVVVPATPVGRGLTWDEDEARAAAQARLDATIATIRGLRRGGLRRGGSSGSGGGCAGRDPAAPGRRGPSLDATARDLALARSGRAVTPEERGGRTCGRGDGTACASRDRGPLTASSRSSARGGERNLIQAGGSLMSPRSSPRSVKLDQRLAPPARADLATADDGVARQRATIGRASGQFTLVKGRPDARHDPRAPLSSCLRCRPNNRTVAPGRLTPPNVTSRRAKRRCLVVTSPTVPAVDDGVRRRRVRASASASRRQGGSEMSTSVPRRSRRTAEADAGRARHPFHRGASCTRPSRRPLVAGSTPADPRARPDHHARRVRGARRLHGHADRRPTSSAVSSCTAGSSRRSSSARSSASSWSGALIDRGGLVLPFAIGLALFAIGLAGRAASRPRCRCSSPRGSSRASAAARSRRSPMSRSGGPCRSGCGPRMFATLSTAWVLPGSSDRRSPARSARRSAGASSSSGCCRSSPSPAP